jgi:peptide deformylase
MASNVLLSMQNDKREGEEWSFNEGCLSIPDVREDVYRNLRLPLSM